MSVDKVEWLIGYQDGGFLHTGSDGAQSVFSRSNAEKLVKRLGAPWSLWHMETHLSPEDHQAFMDSQPKEKGPAWGSNWST